MKDAEQEKKEDDELRVAWRKRIAKFQETQHETFSTDRDQGVEDLIDDIIADKSYPRQHRRRR